MKDVLKNEEYHTCSACNQHLCITCSNTVHFGINALRAGRLYFNKHEVYPDVVEKYGGKTRYDTGQPLDYQNEEEGKFRYLRRMIKQVRKTDEIREGIHGSRKRLQELRELLSTPEGQKEQEIAINVVLAENEFIEFYLNNRDTVEIDKIITELKKECRLQQKYRPNYANISKILEREIANRDALAPMMRQMPYAIFHDNAKRKEEIRKAIKDIIASYCFDPKEFEKEQIKDSKKYDWQALEYR